MLLTARCTTWVMAAALLALAAGTTPAHAGFGDKLKQKAKEQAKKAEDAAGKAAEEAPAAGGSGPTTPAGESGGAPAGSAPAAGADEKVSSVSTKFDYTPGDRLQFFDDFSQDELGEFPGHWTLKEGTLETAEMNGQRWLRSTSVTSRFAMKLAAAAALPENWTLEFDFYCGEPSGNVLNVYGKKGDQQAWGLTFPYSGSSAYVESGKVTATTPLEGTPSVWGVVHHVMLMARGNALKVYINRQRVGNIPEIDLSSGAPDNLELTLWSDRQPMITNVRYAEGPKPLKDPFVGGTLVTYGIYFDTGSDVVKPESAPVLRQIAAWMSANPAVTVKIVGHTDNKGTAAANLDLSKRRAAAVARVLAEQFKLGADRFQTDGLGDTRPIAKNDTGEGRATNRRVEFSKL